MSDHHSSERISKHLSILIHSGESSKKQLDRGKTKKGIFDSVGCSRGKKKLFSYRGQNGEYTYILVVYREKVLRQALV